MHLFNDAPLKSLFIHLQWTTNLFVHVHCCIIFQLLWQHWTATSWHETIGRVHSCFYCLFIKHGDKCWYVWLACICKWLSACCSWHSNLLWLSNICTTTTSIEKVIIKLLEHLLYITFFFTFLYLTKIFWSFLSERISLLINRDIWTCSQIVRACRNRFIKLVLIALLSKLKSSKPFFIPISIIAKIEITPLDILDQLILLSRRLESHSNIL